MLNIETKIECTYCGKEALVPADLPSSVNLEEHLPPGWIDTGECVYCSPECSAKSKDADAEARLEQQGYIDIVDAERAYDIPAGRLHHAAREGADPNSGAHNYFPNAVKVMGKTGIEKWMLPRIEVRRWLALSAPAGSKIMPIRVQLEQRKKLDAICAELNVPSIAHLVRMVAEGEIVVKWRRGL